MVNIESIHNIDKLEQHFDTALLNLQVYKLPLQVALMVSLTVFEHIHRTAVTNLTDRFSAEAAMLHHKGSLEILIPYLFRKCERQEPLGEQMTVTPDILSAVNDGLNFLERYQIVVHAYTHYHQEQFTGSLHGRVADFIYSPGINLGRSSLNFLLHGYHQQRTIKQSKLSGKLPPSTSSTRSREAILHYVRSTDIGAILHSIPEDVYNPIRKIVEATQAMPTVDTNANCGSYSVTDCYNFWLEFMTLMLIYVYACEEKGKIDRGFNLLEHRILRTDLPRLSILLASRGAIEYELALSVLSNLVLDIESSHPDVLVQPLLPIPNTGLVLIAPSLIFTTHWEVCMLRNWTRLYPDLYGKIIASKKAELANLFGKAFDSGRFAISTNRKLTNRQGQLIGDVDVAVFDYCDGLLALFEIKWLIEPDSPKETSRSDQEIAYGIQQVIENKREFQKDAPHFLKQVFPNDDIRTTAVREVKCYVVGHGNVGTKDDEENEIYVLDYFLSTDIITNLSNASLRQILSEIRAKQKDISDSINKIARPLRIKLAGYLLSIPGFGTSLLTSPIERPKTLPLGRNSPCRCGSGRKYKKCCLELAQYTEDVV